MRSFSFTAKNIGDERYLTYVLGEGTEIDEDVLDYMEEENLAELINVVYEEDDDYDYLTYDVSGKVELAEFVSGRSINKAQLFTILRNVSIGLVMIREEAIHLSYILLHKKFIYIDPETYSVQFLCLPVESDGSWAKCPKSHPTSITVLREYMEGSTLWPQPRKCISHLPC